MVPASFQSLRALRGINIAAVGLALASVVAAVLGPILDGMVDHLGTTSELSGVPTLFCGMLWAWLLRRPAKGGGRKIRWSGIASVPLAMLTAGITMAMCVGFELPFNPVRSLFMIAVGAIVGVIFWAPALLFTLVCFGRPIARAERLAEQGLAGEERGEWIVGLTCAAVSAVGLGLTFLITPPPGIDGGVTVWAPRTFAILGLLAGAATTGLALAREARRRAFVASAEAGKIPGYRIDATKEGKVLVRIVAQGKGYRVADFEEDVFELDAQGEAKRRLSR